MKKKANYFSLIILGVMLIIGIVIALVISSQSVNNNSNASKSNWEKSCNRICPILYPKSTDRQTTCKENCQTAAGSKVDFCDGLKSINEDNEQFIATRIDQCYKYFKINPNKVERSNKNNNGKAVNNVSDTDLRNVKKLDDADVGQEDRFEAEEKAKEAKEKAEQDQKARQELYQQTSSGEF